MYKFTNYILGLLVCTALMHCQNQQSQDVKQDELNQATATKISETFESNPNIKILNEGPAGSKFTNSKGEEDGFLVFRIQIFNDKIVPIELEVRFPSIPVPLLPDSITKVEIYVLPDSITPDTLQNAANFGVIGIEDYFNSDLTDPGILKTTIQPKEHHTLYLGILMESEMGSGTIRGKVFLNGQDIDAPFLPVTSIKTEKTGSSSLELIYGIGYRPHNQYILIPFGQINFMK